MDRPRRKNWIASYGGWLKTLAVAVAVLLVSFWLHTTFRAAVDRDEVRIATVTRGTLEASIATTGTLVAAFEEQVSSPVAAEIVEVLAVRGGEVKAGEVLLKLDAAQVRLEVANLEEQVALGDASLRSRELELDEQLAGLEATRALATIDLEGRIAKVDRLEKLIDQGAISGEQLHEAQLDVQRTQVEIEQARAAIERLTKRKDADLERLRLERSILIKRRDEAARRLTLTTVRSPRDGTLIALVDQTGLAVSVGQSLATVAARGAYRVEATLSDFYASQLREGMVVRTASAGTVLTGSLARVLPAAGNLTLFIHLDEPRQPDLRANLRLDVEIVTGVRQDTLMIRRGPATTGSGELELFVLAGDGLARRRAVRLGFSNRHNIEILAGADVGDEVITSNLDRFAGRQTLTVR